MISGLLLFRKPFGALENAKKKVRTLLIPNVFWNLFWIGMVFIVQRIGFDDFGTLNSFPSISKWKVNDWLMLLPVTVMNSNSLSCFPSGFYEILSF